ncbi:flavin reductase family protein [Chloroflexota bacterium]
MNSKALHSLGYGMYVICSIKGNKINGQIANTLFQVTSEPPTIAVSINKNNLTHEFIKDSKVFTASVLCTETPLPYIGRFGFHSGRDSNKFDGIHYFIGKTKAPVVTDYTVAYMEAKVTQEVDAGTHTIFIGEVLDAGIISEKECMTYAHYHQVKRGTTPESAPSYIK